MNRAITAVKNLHEFVRDPPPKHLFGPSMTRCRRPGDRPEEGVLRPATPLPDMAARKGRGRRFLFFSNELVGLGHLRRTLSIANRLAEVEPESSSLIVTGSPVVPWFGMPPRVDILKLPGWTRDEHGERRAGGLALDVSGLHAVRSGIELADRDELRRRRRRRRQAPARPRRRADRGARGAARRCRAAASSSACATSTTRPTASAASGARTCARRSSATTTRSSSTAPRRRRTRSARSAGAT